MWGWLDSVVGGLKTIWETISNIPSSIVNAFTSLFETLWGWLQDLWDAIKDLPSLILDGIKAIFIPDKDALKEDINNLTDSLNHTFNLGIDSKDWLVDSFAEKPLSNIEEDYNIPGVGKMKLSFLDTQYLIRGIEFFRPIIRGFVVLMLLFFNYKQILSFIGQDPGMYASAKQEADKK